jgi:Sortilin, neurotensin receptor 3,
MNSHAATRRAAVLLAACVTLALPPLSSPAADSAPEARLLDAFIARPLGPANMGGRVVDVAVVEGRPTTLYVATASGGLWKTANNGITWTPIFDQQSTVSIGDVAVAPSNPDIVWVGTGEANPRNSVSWGDGLYKSTDAGKTWTHLDDLRDTHHIGRIVIHPKDPDTVYVAAMGHFWGPNRQRGLYKTTDGGKTWQLSKFLNEDTGFIDLVMDPGDPDTLYAAAYAVRRDGFS